MLVAVTACALALAAAATVEARARARVPAAGGKPDYPELMTGPVQADCTGGWELHVAIGSLTWVQETANIPYDVSWDSASGVSFTSRMADGTFWTLDSSKSIGGKLLFSLPPATAAPFALLTIPVVRHYPTGDTANEDQGIGFGNDGKVNVDTPGKVEVVFDRKFTIAATETIPASTCEFKGTFTGTYKTACEKERQFLQFAQADYDAAMRSFGSNDAALRQVENQPYRFLAGPVSGLLATSTMSQLERHDVVADRFERSADRFLNAAKELAKKKKELADCLKGGAAAGGRSLQSWTKRCTDQQWARLARRAKALKLQKLAPRARKIGRELKAGKRAQAERGLKALRTAFKAERKRVGAFEKAMKACR